MEVKIQRHPFALVGYWDAKYRQKTTNDTGEMLYQSLKQPQMFAIIRKADGRTAFIVRGQTYSSLAVARAISI